MTIYIRSFFVFLFLTAAMLPVTVAAATVSLSQRLSGRILLQVEANGEAWYVSPVDLRRHYLGRPADAFNLMRSLGLGITDVDLFKIPTDQDSAVGDSALRQRLSGRILLQVEANGEAWYVSPVDLRRYYLGRPADAFALMRSLGLGITNADLAGITVARAGAALDEYASVHVTTERGEFDALVLTLPRDRYRPRTLVSQNTDCATNCPVKPLADYIAATSAVAGINGSYFCPADYVDCPAKLNSFLWPVYDSVSGVMINEVNLKYHVRPLVIVDSLGQPTLFRNAKIDFGWTVDDYENRTGRKVTAALGNYPTLIENNQIVVESETTLDANQRTVLTNRGGWGWNDTNYLMVIAKKATVIDLASVMKALGATSAMNLDGGGSAAMWYGGSYKIGPGRSLPNAIVFEEK